MGTPEDTLELLDWRRRVSELFAALRARPPDAATLVWFRAQKDDLFRHHPQSPLPPSDRRVFTGLPYWPFDPAARVSARLVADELAPAVDVPDSGHGRAAESDAEMAFSRIGRLQFELWGQPQSLGAYWLHGYAGGLFVPFRDATAGRETYGAGRYLLDTIKSADLGPGREPDSVVLDFNYAYHPSCAYDPRWICPLAPPENWLPIPVRAGERLSAHRTT